MQDIAVNIDSGYYDISITEGDFTLIDGLDTAIELSLFVDKRADESEVAEASLRRGWIGNEQSEDPEYELGSKLWLIEQARSIQNTLNKAIDYSRDCLNWMIPDNLIKDLTVDGSISDDKITINNTFVRFDNSTFNKQFVLWENTTIV